MESGINMDVKIKVEILMKRGRGGLIRQVYVVLLGRFHCIVVTSYMDINGI